MDSVVAAVTKLAHEHPEIVVEPYSRKTHFLIGSIGTPGGKIGDVLSDEALVARARREHAAYTAKVEAKTNPLADFDNPPVEEWIEGISFNVRYNVWQQLIRQSSANDLQFDNDISPSCAILDRSGAGFIVIDGGMQANCDYGRSNVKLYEIISETPQEKIGPFARRTLQVRSSLDIWMQCLSPSAQQPAELRRIAAASECRLFDFYGKIAVIGLPENTRHPQRAYSSP